MSNIKTTKVFKSGNSQAVRLPKEFRLTGDRVYIKRMGEVIVLLPIDQPWHSLLESLTLFSPDYLEERDQPPIQDREEPFS